MNPLDDLPGAVTVYEVGPRDGLQNQPEPVPVDVKVRFVDMLSASGLPRIEVTSFVRPGAIPQLSDAEEVVASINRAPQTLYTALVPNVRGMERARAAGLGGIAVFTAASESFSRHNTNASVAETLQRFRPVAEEARRLKLWLRGYISTAFGCPYEGTVPIDAVVSVARSLGEIGVDEIAVSDTIGVATPRQVVDVIGAMAEAFPLERIALHFHDTRGTALANVLAGLQVGVTTFDSSAGGLGGCPYAPGASGNLATEDLLYMLDGLGIETGVSLTGVVEATRYLAAETGIVPTSRYVQAA
ncbi:MAG TPA: hydroxymethylglutaryl-CoA lyase [Chloroflexota bacterium]|nr:hydroxymethylglutaryl-CoA lyase [Chloroflexota bacterium]